MKDWSIKLAKSSLDYIMQQVDIQGLRGRAIEPISKVAFFPPTTTIMQWEPLEWNLSHTAPRTKKRRKSCSIRVAFQIWSRAVCGGALESKTINSPSSSCFLLGHQDHDSERNSSRSTRSARSLDSWAGETWQKCHRSRTRSCSCGARKWQAERCTRGSRLVEYLVEAFQLNSR